MNIQRLSSNAVRSTEEVRRITSLTAEELKKTVGGAPDMENIDFGFCLPCAGSGCLVYWDWSCVF